MPRRRLVHGRDEIGAKSAQARARFAGIVDLEGGGSKPHPVGGGVGFGSPTEGSPWGLR